MCACVCETKQLRSSSITSDLNIRNVTFKSWPGYLTSYHFFFEDISLFKQIQWQHLSICHNSSLSFQIQWHHHTQNMFVYICFYGYSAIKDKSFLHSLKWNEKDSFMYRDISVSSTLWWCVNTTASGCISPNNTDKTTGTTNIRTYAGQNKSDMFMLFLQLHWKVFKAYRTNVLKMKCMFNFLYFHSLHQIQVLLQIYTEAFKIYMHSVWCLISTKTGMCWHTSVETPQ